MTTPKYEALAREWLLKFGLMRDAGPAGQMVPTQMMDSLASLLAEVAQAEREKCADEMQRQAQDRCLLQDLYAKKFGGHSFEQQREGHAALVLEELSHRLRARSTEDRE